MDNNQLSFINNHSKTAPVNACIFNERAEVRFAEGDADGGRFRIVGYSGGIIKDHWYWGNLAIDLEGLKFAKKRIPVLADHFTSSRIGFSTSQEISDKVEVEGEFLDNDNARSLRDDIKKGFPMEASLFCPPSVIEKVAEGASVKVNGQVLKGPGAVFRKSIIREVSMCVFGADSNTMSSALAGGGNKVTYSIEREDTMDKTKEKLTLDTFAERYPELHSELFEKGRAEGLAEGRKAERDRFAELKDACGTDGALLIDCFEKDMTTGDALKARADKLSEQNRKLSEQMAELKKNPPEKETVDPAAVEFSDEAADPDRRMTFDEKAATEDRLKEHYEKTQALQDEFHDVKAYLAYVKRDVKKN